MACKYCISFSELTGKPLPMNNEEIKSLLKIVDNFKSPHHNGRIRFLLQLGFIMVTKNDKDTKVLKKFLELSRLTDKGVLRNFIKEIPNFKNNPL